ncbi:S53 family peptidase [Derxia lacustris]|uniref:S53 family peptidase n=1 Tax=Derxia lacustris TaxID=764842 RepID=UPI000A1727B3|nr:S53 family peptidase [Derxia lacustris]
MQSRKQSGAAARRALVAGVATLALGACGGGSQAPESSATAASAAAVEPVATPVFAMLPVTVEPPESDADGSGASAAGAGTPVTLPAGAGAIETRGLTLESARAQVAALPPRASAAASSTGAVTYTPAQIRAAYRLPVVPAAAQIAKLAAADRAALGAGQTIYVIGAYRAPKLEADLAAFNARFGLPACPTTALAAGFKPPLLAASAAAGCSFVRLTATAAGGVNPAVPGYSAGWAQEAALDVQWAHALAPLARIVLIEAVSASTVELAGAIRLANALGRGVVSMSFGAGEGGWMSGYDGALFSTAGMTYVASTGDSGTQANWPAISASVLAVGGTTLGWTGSGTRTEKAWASAGGAASTVVARPAYQGLAGLPSMPTGNRRVDADVAFNADPYSGVFTAFTASGASAASWLSMGGTSAGAPAVAGHFAAANALRQLAGKATLGKPHATLYGAVAAVAGNYASVFADVKTGANGTCSTGCIARAGYDFPTGLGSLNFDALMPWLVAAN